ncbi:MAG: hypothetical protein HY452_01190 [Parcubacteria group bacterium]|nr:hypothetical protein [Parcubacteria group bacterium]
MKLGEIINRRPNKRLHSKEHLLAEDISVLMAEPKKFAAYLGIARLYYESDLRALAKRVLEKKDLPMEARGRYFFAAIKGLTKKTNVEYNNRREKQNSKE